MTANIPSRGDGSKHPAATMTRRDWIAVGEALRGGLSVFRELLVAYQRASVRRARQRFPDVAASMTDADVWDLLCR